MTSLGSLEIIQEFKKRHGNSRTYLDVLKYEQSDGSPKKIYIFEDKATSQLFGNEVVNTFLVIRKKWLRYENWSDERLPGRFKRAQGTTIPWPLFFHIDKMNNDLNNLAFYFTNDDNFYISNGFSDIRGFCYKYQIRFIDNWGNDVIGVPREYFHII